MTDPQPKRRLALPTRRAWIDIAVLVALAVIGLLGFAASYSHNAYLVAGIGGLLVGTAAAIVASSLRLGPLLTALVAVAAYFLFGSALAMPAFATLGVLPSSETLSGLAIGAVFGWTDIVTLAAPVGAPDYIAVLPYVASWLVGVVSTTIATRWFTTRRRTPLSSVVALVAPAALYVFSVLAGTKDPFLAPARGVAFALIALVWIAWRVPEGANATMGSANGLLRQKVIGIGMVAVVAVVGGTLLGAAAAPSHRFVLRDRITPPFEVQNYASPLAGFRAYTNDTSKAPLFTVTGLHTGDAIRLAAMDSYDGVVWNVTAPDANPSQSGVFGLVGGDLKDPADGRSGKTETLTVTIDRYQDHWMPTVGYARSVAFTKKAPNSADVRYNPQTGILIDTEGVQSGQQYQMTVDRYSVDRTTLQDAAISSNVPTPIDVPQQIATEAVKFAGNGKTPYQRLHNIEMALIQGGIFSHGTGSVPSIAGHSEWRLTSLVKNDQQMVGDQEQFAAVFALMARSLKYPSRVVIGFEKTGTPTGTTTFTAQDVTAWPEVEFAGIGWVRFDPRPTRTSPPDQTPTQPRQDPLPLSKQPDNTNPNQSDLVSPTEVDKSKKAPEPFQLPDWVVTTALWVGIPLAIYFIPFLIIAAIKRRRRRERQNTGTGDRRAAGAWDELADGYAELGYRAPRTSTRLQAALLFEEQFRQELGAREKERADAAVRASNRKARADAKAAKAEAAAGTPQTRASASASATAFVSGTMARLKDASTWRPGVAGENDALPVLPGLREFAVAADAAVFSGDDVPQAEVDRLWSDLAPVLDAGRRSVSWFRRRVSAFRVRSRVGLGELVARQVAAASTLTRKAITR